MKSFNYTIEDNKIFERTCGIKLLVETLNTSKEAQDFYLRLVNGVFDKEEQIKGFPIYINRKEKIIKIDFSEYSKGCLKEKEKFKSCFEIIEKLITGEYAHDEDEIVMSPYFGKNK